MPSDSKRDAVEVAARPLRELQKEHHDEIAAAQRALRAAEVEAARREPVDREERQRGIRETKLLVHRLGELCESDEDVLDMVSGISAGHEGVLVATDRRLLFVSMRRTLSLPYRDIASVAVKGRRFGSRMHVRMPTGTTAFSGLARAHAEEIAALVRERA